MKGEKKICQDCGRELPLEEFARNRWGYTNICKDCMKAKKAGKASEPEKPAHEVLEEIKEHNEKLRVAANLKDVATPILMDELKRRGWSGTLVQHNELTI